MYRVKLIKTSNNCNELRTKEVEGSTDRLPEVGVPFEMWTDGIDFGTRFISTSPVIFMSGTDDVVIFRTFNSEYFLHVIRREDD